MSMQNSRFWVTAKAVVIVSGLLIVADPGYATENARERRAARDIKQGTRQNAREEKRDCRAANDKSNSECRQDKRETKQTGREASRDVRAGRAGEGVQQ
jgi:hypothetical protein